MAILNKFEAKLACHGVHGQLLKEISIRVKALKEIRKFLEDIFGQENEGHDHVDAYKLAKIRMDVAR